MYDEIAQQVRLVKDEWAHVPAAVALARMTLDLIERLEISEAKVENLTLLLIDQLGERVAHLETEVTELRRKSKGTS